MNTHKLKARHHCFLLLLCLNLVWSGVPGPCRHSMTKDHLLNLNRLIDNQLENGCRISFLFTEHKSLSKVCYIKAVFPHILELLNTHFQYGKRSDNRRYVNTLKKIIYDIYSQRCIPEINEEIEDNPVKFVRLQHTSPKEALRKAKGVFQMYMTLLKESNRPVDWNCEDEYAEDYPESTTALPIVIPGTHVAVLPSSIWSSTQKNTLNLPTSPYLPHSTERDEAGASLKNPGTVEPSSTKRMEQTLLDGTSTHEERDMKISRRSYPALGVESVSGVQKTEWDIPPFTNAPHLLPQPNPVLMKTPSLKDRTSFSYPETEGRIFVFEYNPLGNGLRGSARDELMVSGVSTNTPATFLYEIVDPRKEESTAYVLAKRSLDDGNYGIQLDSKTDPSLPQDGVTALNPEGVDTAVRFKSGKKYLDYRDQWLEELLTSAGKTKQNHVWTGDKEVVSTAVLSIREAKEPIGSIRGEESSQSHWITSYQTAFIIAAVCGGLLVTTLYCVRQKQRLRAIFQSPRVIENQRTRLSTKDIELQYNVSGEQEIWDRSTCQ